MKITVELIKDPARPGWKLSVGDKYAECLTYDEMLGLFVSVSMPKDKRCLAWLKTAQEHGVYEEAFKQSIMGKKDEEGDSENKALRAKVAELEFKVEVARIYAGGKTKEQSDPANLDFLMF
jgi:hypothetical protein